MKMEKYSQLLNDQQPGVYSICNGQVAPDTVNVQNALAIGSEQSRQVSGGRRDWTQFKLEDIGYIINAALLPHD